MIPTHNIISYRANFAAVFKWTLGELFRNLVCDWRERDRSGNFHKGDRLINLFTGEISSPKASAKFAFAKDEDFHRWNEALNLQNHTGKLPVEFNQKYINKVIKEHNRWISEVGIFNNRQTGGRSEQVIFARELVVLVFSLLTVK